MSFRVAYKSLLITGRPYLIGGVEVDPTPSDLLYRLLLTKLMSPLILSYAYNSNALSLRTTIPIIP